MRPSRPPVAPPNGNSFQSGLVENARKALPRRPVLTKPQLSRRRLTKIPLSAGSRGKRRVFRRRIRPQGNCGKPPPPIPRPRRGQSSDPLPAACGRLWRRIGKNRRFSHVFQRLSRKSRVPIRRFARSCIAASVPEISFKSGIFLPPPSGRTCHPSRRDPHFSQKITPPTVASSAYSYLSLLSHLSLPRTRGRCPETGGGLTLQARKERGVHFACAASLADDVQRSPSCRGVYGQRKLCGAFSH